MSGKAMRKAIVTSSHRVERKAAKKFQAKPPVTKKKEH